MAVSELAVAWRRRAGGCIWSLRLPSSPRTIHGMMSWPPDSGSESENGSGSEGLGLGFGGAKEMLNCGGEEEEEEEGSDEVMMRGSVRKGLRVREGLEKMSEEESDATVAAIFSQDNLGGSNF